MIVWKTRVYSRNFISDFGAKLKNIIGGRLKTYEVMLDKGIKEVTDDLQNDYPGVNNIRMQITEFQDASISVTAYGEWNDK